MEKSRAIELLKLAIPIKALTQQEYADFVEAVNMGIDALEQPTSPDTIDRKAALDALRRCQTYLYDARDPELKIELSSAEAAIKELPTIQPEKAQLSKEGTTKDTISRQAALDIFDDYNVSVENGELEAYSRDRKRMCELPPAQPEPQWIPVSERLPEKNGEYLVTTQWWNGDIDTSLYEYGATHKEWNDGDMCGQKVIAWMPLPEAYKPNK